MGTQAEARIKKNPKNKQGYSGIIKHQVDKTKPTGVVCNGSSMYGLQLADSPRQVTCKTCLRVRDI